MNLTVVNPTASGYLTVWPSDTTRPATSTVNFNAGTTTAEFAVTKTAADGTVSIYNPFGNSDVLLDVAGWFGPAAAGTFQATAPTRVLDTRPTGACLTPCATIAAGSTLKVVVADRNGLPSAPQIAANITVLPTTTTTSGYVTVWPGTTPQPGVSTVNFNPGQTAVANAAVVKLGPDGTLSISAQGAAVHVLLDIQGWFAVPAPTTTYTYDADGLRATKTTSGTTTTFTWDRSTTLPNLLQDGTNTYTYGPDGLPHQQITTTTNQTSWLHHDQLGSTRLITNDTGTPTGTATYNTYGTPTTQTGTTPLGYTGQYTDPETGLQYLRARYYDPQTAQFLSRDPIEALTRSAYGYVDGDPLNSTDPSGLRCWTGKNDNGSCRSIARGTRRVAQSDPAQVVMGAANAISYVAAGIAAVAGAGAAACTASIVVDGPLGVVCAVRFVTIAGIANTVGTYAQAVNTAIECADGDAGFDCAAGVAGLMLGGTAGPVAKNFLKNSPAAAALFEACINLAAAGAQRAREIMDSGP